MPLKTWAPNERLTAGDLNANFALVASGQMPGVVCGATVTGIALVVSTPVEIKPTAPSVDTNGYWNATTSRVVIPAGLAGLYLVTATIEASGGVAGEWVRLRILPYGTGRSQSITRYTGGIAYGQALAVGSFAEGTQIYADAIAYGAGAPGTAKLMELSVFRLASFSAIGALLAELQPLPAIPDHPDDPIVEAQ
jgi:hypothetical protein